MILLKLISLLLISYVIGSQGDQSIAYSNCIQNQLNKNSNSNKPTLLLKLLGWTELNNIEYFCSQALTDACLKSKKEKEFDLGGKLEGLIMGKMVQFNGKWPFKRLLGIQEPLSVLFSLFNFFGHFIGYKKLKRVRVGSESGKELRFYYLLNGLVGMNAWLFSILFHVRDLHWTECGDYFSAFFLILYGLYLVIIRLSKQFNNLLLKLLFISIFCGHIYYLLSASRFNYDYNIKINLIIGVIQILLWFTFSIHQCLFNPIPNRILPLLPLLLLLLSTSLEVFDFSPIPHHYRLLDAHATWHLSTIPIVYLWYNFLLDDLKRFDPK